jgi:hypothetical protein
VIKVKENEDDPFKHLPADEAAILKRQVDVTVVPTSFKELYRYATRNDKIIIAISVVCSIAGGAALPLMTVRADLEELSIFFTNPYRSSLVSLLVSSKAYSVKAYRQGASVTLWRVTSCISSTSQLLNL